MTPNLQFSSLVSNRYDMFWYLRAVSSCTAPCFLSNILHLLLNLRQACEFKLGTLLLQLLAELSFRKRAKHGLDDDAGDLVWVAVGSCLIVSKVATRKEEGLSYLVVDPRSSPYRPSRTVLEFGQMSHGWQRPK